MAIPPAALALARLYGIVFFEVRVLAVDDERIAQAALWATAAGEVGVGARPLVNTQGKGRVVAWIENWQQALGPPISTAERRAKAKTQPAPRHFRIPCLEHAAYHDSQTRTLGELERMLLPHVDTPHPMAVLATRSSHQALELTFLSHQDRHLLLPIHAIYKLRHEADMPEPGDAFPWEHAEWFRLHHSLVTATSRQSLESLACLLAACTRVVFERHVLRLSTNREEALPIRWRAFLEDQGLVAGDIFELVFEGSALYFDSKLEDSSGRVKLVVTQTPTPESHELEDLAHWRPAIQRLWPGATIDFERDVLWDRDRLHFMHHTVTVDSQEHTLKWNDTTVKVHPDLHHVQDVHRPEHPTLSRRRMRHRLYSAKAAEAQERVPLVVNLQWPLLELANDTHYSLHGRAGKTTAWQIGQHRVTTMHGLLGALGVPWGLVLQAGYDIGTEEITVALRLTHRGLTQAIERWTALGVSTLPERVRSHHWTALTFRWQASGYFTVVQHRDELVPLAQGVLTWHVDN